MNRHSSRIILSLAMALIAIPAAAHDRINTVVGGGPIGIPGLASNLAGGKVAVDAQGNVYIAAGNIYKLSTSGTLSLIAGDSNQFYDGASGRALHIQLSNPRGIAVDSATPANVYIADTGNCLIRKLDQKTGLISVLAGVPSQTTCGYGGDGGPANEAQLDSPEGLAIDSRNGDLYIVDVRNSVVRKVAGGSAQGTISTVAGVAGLFCGQPSPDGSMATSVSLCGAQDIALDTSVTPANFFVANYDSIDEVVGQTGKIYRVAGDGNPGYKDGVPAPQGEFQPLSQISAFAQGGKATILVADPYNYDIRQFTVTFAGQVPHPGLLTTIAGETGSRCNVGSTLALGACMSPIGVAQDRVGGIFISDGAYDNVYQITPGNSNLATILGWARQPFGPPPMYTNPEVLHDSRAVPELYYPGSVFADPDSTKVYFGGGFGAVYVWDSASNRISDFAGNGFPGLAGDGSPANGPSTQIIPSGMAKDSKGNIYIAGGCSIRMVSASTGDISTIAGASSTCGYSGDGGPALSAQFNGASALAFDAAGNLFVADSSNCVIRRIAAQTNRVSTVAGAPLNSCNGNYLLPSGDGGPATQAQLCNPSGVSLDGAGNIYIADYCDSVVRKVDAATGIIQTIAGYFGSLYNNGGPYSGTVLPVSLKADRNGNVFFTDEGAQTATWISPDGAMTTFAGIYTQYPQNPYLCPGGFYGDGGVATDALFNTPAGIDQDAYGNFYIADSCNNRIRQVSAFPAFGLTTGTLSFASQKVGTASTTQIVTLSSIGPTTVRLVTASDGFQVTSNCAGKELPAGQTCQITVAFAPKKAGSQQGFVRIYSNAFFSQQAISLSGLAQ